MEQVRSLKITPEIPRRVGCLCARGIVFKPSESKAEGWQEHQQLLEPEALHCGRRDDECLRDSICSSEARKPVDFRSELNTENRGIQ